VAFSSSGLTELLGPIDGVSKCKVVGWSPKSDLPEQHVLSIRSDGMVVRLEVADDRKLAWNGRRQMRKKDERRRNSI
jgi:hypothetical protein